MLSAIKILAVAALWYIKSSSLPKFYFGMCNKRGILVSTSSALEKQGKKLVKPGLDIKDFESCLDLNLCTEFLKFKIPNLNVHSNRKNVF